MATLREMINASSMMNEAVDPVKTAAKMGDKIKAKFLKDRTVDNNTDVEKFIADVARHIDPTKNHQYTLWILRMYIKDGIRLHEDLDRVNVALTTFHTYKQQMPIKDLGQIKSLSDLEQMVRSIEIKKVSGKQEKRDTSSQAKEETKVFYKGSEGMIVIPESREASCFWGKGTQWCTASTESRNYFQTYSDQGPLYIILPKDGTKWQLHVESGQFLDANDEDFNVGEWSEKYPWAKDALVGVYPRLNTLESLRGKLSPSDFADEVYSRANSPYQIPSIERVDVENDVVILDEWNSMESLLHYVDSPAGFDDAYDIDEDDYLESFAENVDATLAFEEAVTSLLSNAEKAAITRNAGVPMTDNNVYSLIFEQPEYIDIIGQYARENDLTASTEEAAKEEVEVALLSLIDRSLDEHRAYFVRRDDGGISLHMSLGEFVDGVDAIDDEYSDEAFRSENWTDANNETVDEIMKDQDTLTYMGKEVALIKNFIRRRAGTDVTLVPEADTQTKDMFGSNGGPELDDDNKKLLVVPQSVILDLVDQVKRDLRGIKEAKQDATLKRRAGIL